MHQMRQIHQTQKLKDQQMVISKKDKYEEVIRENSGSTCKEIAVAISRKYPDILIEACEMGIKQKRPIDGLVHVATCVSSWVSQGRYNGIGVDDSNFPRKIIVVD